MSHADFLAIHEEAMQEAALGKGVDQMIKRADSIRGSLTIMGNLVPVELGAAVCGITVVPEIEDVERELALAQLHMRNVTNALNSMLVREVIAETAPLKDAAHRAEASF